MPDSYRVIITHAALADLGVIADYARTPSPQNAQTISQVILEAVDSLAFMPTCYKVFGKTRNRSNSIHAMVVRPFILYYRVQENTENV